MPDPANDLFWKRKLAAYLHDPPEKALDLAWHRRRAEAHQGGRNLDDVKFATEADHTAAAADRLPWPTYQHLQCRFDGDINYFKHPLGRACLKIKPFATADLATDTAWTSRPILHHVSPEANFDQLQFFAFWRFWRWWASDQRDPQDPRMAFLPADTRLPDHTIWAHNSLVSALQACVVDGECKPAFLLFNIGPVQDFIAAARRTLDLWSGSYLLSYLTASALKHLALTLGPDQVIFPNLCGQPIFDLLLEKEIWSKAFTGPDEAHSLWESLGYHSGYPKHRLLTPSLPNRFLALVPAPNADTLAKEVAGFVEATFNRIVERVWNLATDKLDCIYPITAQNERFFAQAERHLEISWQTLPWPKMPDDAVPMVAHLPSADDVPASVGLQTILQLAAAMPKHHRDVRNFECDRFQDGSRRDWKDQTKLRPDARLDNPGAAWSPLYSLLNWQLDAVRQTRAWVAWLKPERTVSLMNEKDSLTGKEEAVLNLATSDVTDELARTLSAAIGPRELFKKGEVLGALTLIKRIWPIAWLTEQHDFKPHHFRVPDTRKIADGDPYGESTGEEDEGPIDHAYFAVIAFDGDEIGKWISGQHPEMPTLGDLLADYRVNSQQEGARKYFEDNPTLTSLLRQKRPLNPSFHLQFSEMLGTFSNVCARRVVEAFDGYLIYSGGDDVLAVVPSLRALPCAQALRAAFRGTGDLNEVHGAWDIPEDIGQRPEKRQLKLFRVDQEGFIALHSDNRLVMQGEPKRFPAIVPGPATDCSVGIAIAHFKSPLQDVVRAAQAAEKRAKNELGRKAVAVSLFKRSGEITEWGCRWDSGGLALYKAIATLFQEDKLTGRFPHRVCQLLEPYLTIRTALSGFEDAVDENTAVRIITDEFSFAVQRQSSTGAEEANWMTLRPLVKQYLSEILKRERHIREDPEHETVVRKGRHRSIPQLLLQSIIGLCTTVAFAHRTRAASDQKRLPKAKVRPAHVSP